MRVFCQDKNKRHFPETQILNLRNFRHFYFSRYKIILTGGTNDPRLQPLPEVITFEIFYYNGVPYQLLLPRWTNFILNATFVRAE